MGNYPKVLREWSIKSDVMTYCDPRRGGAKGEAHNVPYGAWHIFLYIVAA